MRGLLLLLAAWVALPSAADPPYLMRGSERHVTGELVEADFIHRTGQFRADSGELVDFSLLPFATVMVFDAEADLRDMPLGTRCQFSLYPDARGALTKVAAIHDEFSRLAGQGHRLRLDRINLDAGKLDLSSGIPGDSSPLSFSVSDKTRVWKGDGKRKLGDLEVGDELLVNITGNDSQRRCTDIWADAESQKLATAQQHKRHIAFLKERGLAALIDRVDGKKLTVTLFGDPSSMQALCKQEGIVPSLWATEHRGVDAVVSNEELRTYNPPVDRKRATILDYQQVPTDAHGCSGIRWVIEPDLLLEGFRKGRVIRLFVHPSWPVNDMAFGESLYSEAPGVRAGVEEPFHYSYRTDFANEHLPWYRLKSGEFPPFQSHHLVAGELLKVDVAKRSGQFRTDRTGELVEFTMPPFGTVKYLNAEGDISDLPLGTRYLFSLHQDERGSFTKATVISDEFTKFANDEFSYRLDAVELDEGRISLAKRHAPVKNEKEDFIQPPDLSRGFFAVDATTRVWKGDKRIGLKDLVLGDELLLNQRGETATSRGICADIWVGRETHKLATNKQATMHDAFLRANGLPAWIETVEGKSLVITFFSGSPKEFRATFEKDVKGDGGTMILADEQLRPNIAAAAKLRFNPQFVDKAPEGRYGSSGIRWHIEAERVDEQFRPGQIVRVFRQGWPIPDKIADR